MFRIFALVVFGWLLSMQALAEVVPFGNLNVSYRATDDNGADDSLLTDEGSRFGVRWSQYLNDDIEARYMIEASSALVVQSDLIDELRQAWLGLRGSFGEVRVGRHLGPVRVALDPVDLFTDQPADQNKVLEAEVLHDKSIAYINRLNGVGYAAVLSADDDNDFSADMLLNYNTEQLYLVAAYLHGSDQYNALRLGGTYRFPAGHHLGLAFEHLDDTQGNTGHNAYLLSAGYQFDTVLLKGQWGRNDPEAGGYAETLLGIGVDYALQPSTTLQAQYSVNKHRDHTAADREQVLSFGLSFEF